MSTILAPQEAEATPFVTGAAEKSSTLLSSSPAETPGRKRTRAALRAMSLNDGSPEKKETSARKPMRKVSRASSSGSKKGKDVVTALEVDFKTTMANDEDKENQMVLDV